MKMCEVRPGGVEEHILENQFLACRSSKTKVMEVDMHLAQVF